MRRDKVDFRHKSITCRYNAILTDCLLVPDHFCVSTVLLSWKVYFTIDCSKCCWRSMVWRLATANMLWSCARYFYFTAVQSDHPREQKNTSKELARGKYVTRMLGGNQQSPCLHFYCQQYNHSVWYIMGTRTATSENQLKGTQHPLLGKVPKEIYPLLWYLLLTGVKDTRFTAIPF